MHKPSASGLSPERVSTITERTSTQAKAPSGAMRGDAVALVALARLERDHVALLAALCDLETADSRHLSAALRDALAVLLRGDLRQTQRALKLAAEGRYGICERCHTPLASVALLTTPATTRCPSCVGTAARTR